MTDTEKPAEPPRSRSRVALEVFMWVAVATLVYVWSQGRLAPRIESGQTAPDFELVSTHGRRFRLSEQRGKVVVLNFWATWCGPCRMELPHLSELYSEMDPDAVTFLAVALQSNPEEVKQFETELKLPFPVLFGDGKVDDLYGIRGFPTTLIVGADGQVEKIFGGYTTNWSVKKAVETALAKRKKSA